MKSASRLLSIVTFALASATVVSCARTESVYEYPRQMEIDARQINATHSLNNMVMAPCPMETTAEISHIDLVVNFESNSDKLTPAAKAQIAKVAGIISSPNFHGQHITVEGYTDAVGKPGKNVSLSYHRAEIVIHELVHKYNLPASMFTAEGMGAANPVATNTTAAGRAANRRVGFNVR